MKLGIDVARALRFCGGERLQGAENAHFGGVSIDTRTLEAGDLFVAIAGPHHDAHDFLAQAAARGAGGLLVERGRALPAGLDPALPVLAAKDTTRALGDLARGHRADFEGPVVAITGSNGKTTTKEMCAAILECGAPTLRTRGNLNNQYGLPLTLLAREARHERIVVELGMNHPGEIAPLAGIARPGVGVVTNVGTAHIENLGSREAIADEKGALLEALPEDGTAVVLADDPFRARLTGRTRARVVGFGRGGEVRADAPERDGADGWRFRLLAPEGGVAVRVAGLAETSVVNALAAAAAALAAGATLEEVALGLSRYRPPAGRQERRVLPDGLVLIDDAYNANPQSMDVALRLLADCAGGRRIAVIGDMGELGEQADEAHREAGRCAARLGIDFVVAVGTRAERVLAGAREGGMDPARLVAAADSEAAGPRVREIAEPGDTILLKGSRAMRMERVGRHLEAPDGDGRA